MVTRCPLTWGLFLGSIAIVISLKRRQKQRLAVSPSPSSPSAGTAAESSCLSPSDTLPECEVVFVLGAPGTGKGTQCQLLQERLREDNNNNNNRDNNNDNDGQVLEGESKTPFWKHLSAGDLLREERKSGGELGDLINSRIDAGELVPSSITVRLLENAMIKSHHESASVPVPATSNSLSNECIRFLIDGFPRSQENIQAWEDTMKLHTVKFVLNFVCPEEVLVGRLLERGKDSGRSDDNLEVIRKRFKTHQISTVPILAYFHKKNIPLHTIDSAKGVEQVYDTVAPLLSSRPTVK